MALRSSRVTATTTRARIFQAPAWATSADPVPVIVTNRDAAQTAYLGGDDVTSANGFDLLAGESVTYDAMLGDDIWAVTGAATAALRVLVGRAN